MSAVLANVADLLGAASYGIVKARVVAPQKIDDQYVWLTGINANYLQQFPEWRLSLRSRSYVSERPASTAPISSS